MPARFSGDQSMTNTSQNDLFALPGENVPVSPLGASIRSNRPCAVNPQTEVLPAPVRDLADLLARLAADHPLNQSASGQ